ncbi:inner membrane protein YhjD [Mycobacteroides salmoniphilum]|uniref:inner membrane protein YhjD n=1 Tax=Mycobacteroides salmoniphilum TaxID=404941 RepID=UPI0009947FCD|nr:inner membrane protein YhjD [Mycobacteroides salmoniphilum]
MVAEDDKPGILDRYRARFPWFDHIMRMQERYQKVNGNFYAAGITYFTVFALFPLMMVGFAVMGFVLSRRPDTIAELRGRISGAISGEVGNQLINLMDTAIASRTSLGIAGLATAAWAGLGWMANVRAALSAMWEQPNDSDGFVRGKLSDLVALGSTFVALALTIAVTVIGNEKTILRILGWVGLHDVSIPAVLLKVVTIAIATVLSWALFTWMIARLPRERLPFSSAARAGLVAAIGFELFKQVASIYLSVIMHGPAGSTFGPVLGIMVFAYITARLLLYATAWAATSDANQSFVYVPPPEPVVITTRVETVERPSKLGVLAAFGAGAVGALGISWLGRGGD